MFIGAVVFCFSASNIYFGRLGRFRASGKFLQGSVESVNALLSIIQPINPLRELASFQKFLANRLKLDKVKLGQEFRPGLGCSFFLGLFLGKASCFGIFLGLCLFFFGLLLAGPFGRDKDICFVVVVVVVEFYLLLMLLRKVNLLHGRTGIVGFFRVFLVDHQGRIEKRIGFGVVSLGQDHHTSSVVEIKSASVHFFVLLELQLQMQSSVVVVVAVAVAVVV
mmetsp:Transcript_17194/g.42883  ORF Transcript_17194/g.42883 Transcript_17194/m.42883 type:complete len:222 (-) Transcript_17194:1676-2341(-)